MARKKSSSEDVKPETEEAQATPPEVTTEESGPDQPDVEPTVTDADTPKASATDEPAETTGDEAADTEEPDPEDAVAAEADVAEETAEPEPTADDTLLPAPTPQPEKRRGGAVPGFIGGAIAACGIAALGYVYLDQQNGLSQDRINELRAAQEVQTETLSDLRDQVAAGPDLSGITARLDEIAAGIEPVSNQINGVAADVTALADRVTELEKRPLTDAVSEDAIAAYEAELDRLRDAMERQRQEVEALIEEARAMESNASDTAEATLRRAALTRILSALDSGAPFASALADLEAAGQDVPAALAKHAESGVATMVQLRDSYPDAARAALSVARRTGDEGSGSVGDFLRDLLGARSLEPRDGESADAILSRVEAALRAGRLNDALAEIATLPDGPKAELAAWTQTATARQEAVSAAEELSAALNAE